ncbi:MAG: hypothetical protein IPM24_04570 [Bryobacterales bacterium]|nr:hypothetical protein [Bryobacterales bacterium]
MTRLIAALLLAVAIAPAELRIGRGIATITPPAGMPVGGGFRPNFAKGVHDELVCKALVLDEGGTRAAIVSCDVESLHRPTVVAARAHIDRAGSIRGADVMICATHTHSGPEMTPLVLEGLPDEAGRIARAYHEELPRKIAEAVRLAEGNLVPARVWAGRGREDTVAFNRRYLMKDGSVRFNPGKGNPDIVRPAGPIDPDLPVVYFDSPEGAPLATHVNYAMHAAIGSPGFSADFPGVIAKILASVKGPDMLTLFTAGPQGNTNHVDTSSTAPQRGVEEMHRIGSVLAGETLRTYKTLRPVTAARLAVRSEIVELPVPSFSEKERAWSRETIAQARQGGQPQPTFLELVHAFTIHNVTVAHRARPIPAEVQVIVLGDEVAWVGLPGENFVEHGITIKTHSPFPYTVVSTLANDMIDYVPNRRGFEEGSYEAVNARCLPGCGELLAETANRMLSEMYRGRNGTAGKGRLR